MIREWKSVERYKEDYKLMAANLSNIIADEWKTETIIISIFHFAFIFSLIKSYVLLTWKYLLEKYLTGSIIVRRMDFATVLQFSCKCQTSFFPFWVCQQNTQIQYFP